MIPPAKAEFSLTGSPAQFRQWGRRGSVIQLSWDTLDKEKPCCGSGLLKGHEVPHGEQTLYSCSSLLHASTSVPFGRPG